MAIRSNIPDSIPNEDWPAYSSDLYRITLNMQHKIFNLNGVPLARFKQLLTQTWNEIPEKYIRDACETFLKELRVKW